MNRITSAPAGAGLLLFALCIALAACGDPDRTTTSAAASSSMNEAGAAGEPIGGSGAGAAGGSAPTGGGGAGGSCQDVVPEVQLLATSAAIAGDSLTLNDTAAAVPIIAGDMPITANTTLAPQLALSAAPNGFDLEVAYHNTTSLPAALGDINIGRIMLEASLFRVDLGQGTNDRVIDVPTEQGFHYAGTYDYPDGYYSPSYILRDSRYTVAVTVQYPLLDYRHRIRGTIWSDKTEPTSALRRWTVAMQLDDELPPGAQRSYRVLVRVVPAGHSWLHALVAYRNWFRATYGPVRYTKNPGPVLAAPAAVFGSPGCSSGNPYGYTDESLRPDVNGWGPWAARLSTAEGKGYPRTMMWTPTGLYCDNPDLNYPPQFMTKILDEPVMAATVQELAGVPSPGLELGFWWGRSTQVIQPWDTPNAELLDPQNPAHRAFAFAELDMAVSLGATQIGLDAFGASPSWSNHEWMSYAWMLELQAHAPGVTFVTENLRSDALHTLAPSFLRSIDVAGPHVLADFLVPGHETWAGIEYQLVFSGDPLWWNKTLVERLVEVQRVADAGFVPVVWHDDTPVTLDHHAEDTLAQTVPLELRSPCDR